MAATEAKVNRDLGNVSLPADHDLRDRNV